MVKKKILVLQNIACEDLGTMEGAIKERDLEFEYRLLYNGDSAPSNLDSYSGLIVLGGPMNVDETEKHPFLLDEGRLIKDALNNEVPLLGLCLGAQLIAKTAGANVYAGNRKEIGWHSVSLTDDGCENSLFAGFEKDVSVFQWHGDTFDIPTGAKRLAKSDLFPNQAFAIGKKAIGLQFHLEVTEDAVYRWMDEYQEELDSLNDYIDAVKIRKETPERIESLTVLAKRFYSNFFELI